METHTAEAWRQVPPFPVDTPANAESAEDFVIPRTQTVLVPILLLALQILKLDGQCSEAILQSRPQLTLVAQPDRPRQKITILDVVRPLVHPVPHGAKLRV